MVETGNRTQMIVANSSMMTVSIGDVRLLGNTLACLVWLFGLLFAALFLCSSRLYCEWRLLSVAAFLSPAR